MGVPLLLENEAEIRVRPGVVGAEGHRAAMDRHRLVHVPEGGQDHAQMHERFARIRRKRGRAEEALHALDQRTLRLEGEPQIDVRRDVGGLEGEGLPVGRDGLVETAQGLQGHGKVVVNVGDVRCEGERPAIARHRLGESPLGVQRAAQVPVRIRVPWGALERRAEGRLRLVQAPLSVKDDPEVVARLCIFRVEGERSAQRGFRLSGPAPALEHPPQAGVKGSNVGGDGDGLTDQPGALLVEAALVRKDAESVERIGMLGIEDEHLTVQGLRLVEPPAVVVADRGREEAAGALDGDPAAAARELRVLLRLAAPFVTVHGGTAPGSFMSDRHVGTRVDRDVPPRNDRPDASRHPRPWLASGQPRSTRSPAAAGRAPVPRPRRPATRAWRADLPRPRRRASPRGARGPRATAHGSAGHDLPNEDLPEHQ